MSDSNPPGEVIDVVAAIQRIGQQIAPLLARFADPSTDRAALVAELMPRSGDFAKAFRADIAPQVEQAFAALMQSGLPEIDPQPGQTQVSVHACPAGFLGQKNPLSAPFPSEYASLAPYLIRKRVWLVWHYTQPGATDGITYNGLVFLDDHWAWFPKPYQVIATLTAARE